MTKIREEIEKLRGEFYGDEYVNPSSGGEFDGALTKLFRSWALEFVAGVNQKSMDENQTTDEGNYYITMGQLERTLLRKLEEGV